MICRTAGQKYHVARLVRATDDCIDYSRPQTTQLQFAVLNRSDRETFCSNLPPQYFRRCASVIENSFMRFSCCRRKQETRYIHFSCFPCFLRNMQRYRLPLQCQRWVLITIFAFAATFSLLAMHLVDEDAPRQGAGINASSSRSLGSFLATFAVHSYKWFMETVIFLSPAWRTLNNNLISSRFSNVHLHMVNAVVELIMLLLRCYSFVARTRPINVFQRKTSLRFIFIVPNCSIRNGSLRRSNRECVRSSFPPRSAWNDVSRAAFPASAMHHIFDGTASRGRNDQVAQGEVFTISSVDQRKIHLNYLALWNKLCACDVAATRGRLWERTRTMHQPRSSEFAFVDFSSMSFCSALGDVDISFSLVVNCLPFPWITFSFPICFFLFTFSPSFCSLFFHNFEMNIQSTWLRGTAFHS